MNNNRCADDTVLTVDTKEKLQELVSALNRICMQRGMEVNFGPAKTDVLRLTKISRDLNLNFTLNGRALSFRIINRLGWKK